jgi:hypothetical protein
MKRTPLSVAAIAAVVMTTACQTDLTSLNNNPNSPTTAPASALFTNAVQSAGGRWIGAGQLSSTELFAQHLAQVQYVEEDRGRLRTETIDGWFTSAYTGELEDLQKVIDAGKAANSPNTTGPATVMQQWVFQNMTDFWGDIPYSEALQGDAGGPLKPKYDAQQDIYYAMLQKLTEASTTMQTGSTDAGLTSGDLIYKGDIAKWKKLANSLRARMAMRIIKADPTKAATELAAAFNDPGGVMESNDDIAKISWPGDGVFDNPWSGTFETRDDHRVSKTLLDTLNALQDPRMKVYAQPTVADPTKYVGLQNGMDNATVAPFYNTTSRPGAIFYPGATTYGTFGTPAGKATPSYIMTYAEVEFLEAEAAELGIGGQTGAAAHYNAGVRASIKQWGGTDAEADAYLARTGVAYVAGATGLKQIALQTWISMFTQGTEAWSVWRRTGNPATIHIGPSAYPELTEPARRMTYPVGEQAVNKDAVTAAIAHQGPDTFINRVWWDKP